MEWVIAVCFIIKGLHTVVLDKFEHPPMKVVPICVGKAPIKVNWRRTCDWHLRLTEWIGTTDTCISIAVCSRPIMKINTTDAWCSVSCQIHIHDCRDWKFVRPQRWPLSACLCRQSRLIVSWCTPPSVVDALCLVHDYCLCRVPKCINCLVKLSLALVRLYQIMQIKAHATRNVLRRVGQILWQRVVWQ